MFKRATAVAPFVAVVLFALPTLALAGGDGGAPAPAPVTVSFRHPVPASPPVGGNAVSGSVAGNRFSGGYAKYALIAPSHKDFHITLTQTNGCLPVPGDKGAPGQLGFKLWRITGPQRSTQSGQCSSQLAVAASTNDGVVEVYNFSDKPASFTLSADDSSVTFQEFPEFPTLGGPCPGPGCLGKTPNPFHIIVNVGPGSATSGQCVAAPVGTKQVAVTVARPTGTPSSTTITKVVDFGPFDDYGDYTVTASASSTTWSCDSDGGASNNAVTVHVPEPLNPLQPPPVPTATVTFAYSQ